MYMLSEEQIQNLKNSLPKEIGQAIINIRKQKRITQITLADLTQKDRQYIYKIEKGVVTPNIVTIAIIAKALDVSIAELLKDF